MQYRYGYQGQYAEKDGETGWNSFELRQYDVVIGRWLSPDPYGQYNSPYVGMGNDWANNVDPDGGFTDPIYGIINGVRVVTMNGITSVALKEVVVTATRIAGPAAATMSGAGRAASDFVAGFTNAQLSNSLSLAFTDISLYRRETAYISRAHNLGMAVGDAVSTAQGVYESVYGAGLFAVGAVGTGLLEIPSLGTVTVPGVAVSVTGGAIMLHGASTAINGFSHGLENLFGRRQLNSDGAKGGGRKMDHGVEVPDGFTETKEFPLSQSKGQKVYKKGTRYISRDMGDKAGEAHNGGVWKSFRKLGRKLDRTGTLDKDLKKFKD